MFVRAGGIKGADEGSFGLSRGRLMRVVNWLVAGVAASVAVVAAPARGAERIDPAKFGEIHSLIKPRAEEETWANIPWMASLWEARERAAKEGKPILLWEMDGHPLGCV
jgi:hypothetical protein